MSEQQEDVRITLRLPKELHEQLMRLAQGGNRRPPASLNATIVFALRVGLETLEKEPGQWEPELMAA